MFNNIDFSSWPPEREQKLKNIWRYSMFERMYYRSNLWMHTHRMLWMIETTADISTKTLHIDVNKARTLALVHDDAEMITGDIQAGHKFFMSKTQLKKIDEAEEEAIGQLSRRFPKKLNGYSYEELLTRALQKDTPESQLVMYFDKLDAFCECLHEILAGNILFLRSVMFYERIMTLFPTTHPLIAEMLEEKELPFFDVERRESPTKVTVASDAHFNRPHTPASIKIKSDFPFYNSWRELVAERGGKEGTRWLTKQRER